jgi:hypothetical protein
MAITDFTERADSIELRGTLGVPNGLGFFRVGFSYVGEYNEWAGVYQRRPRPNGQIIVKMKHYYPIDVPSTPKTVWRTFYGNVIKYWHELNDAQKNKLKNDGVKFARSGINRLCTEYTREKPFEMGSNILGYSALGNFKYFENL